MTGLLLARRWPGLGSLSFLSPLLCFLLLGEVEAAFWKTKKHFNSLVCHALRGHVKISACILETYLQCQKHRRQKANEQTNRKKNKMKITVADSNNKPVTFDITPKNLRAFNLSQGGTIKYAPSFNESVNKQRGLPTPEARQWLSNLHSHAFGIMNGNLTMSDVKKALE